MTYPATPQDYRELRLRAGLTQAQLAERLEMHQPRISAIETGAATPHSRTYAEALLGIVREREDRGDDYS